MLFKILLVESVSVSQILSAEATKTIVGATKSVSHFGPLYSLFPVIYEMGTGGVLMNCFWENKKLGRKCTTIV